MALAVNVNDTHPLDNKMSQLVRHFVNRARLIDDIDGKSHKTDLKSSRNYLTNHLKSKVLMFYHLKPRHCVNTAK